MPSIEKRNVTPRSFSLSCGVAYTRLPSTRVASRHRLHTRRRCCSCRLKAASVVLNLSSRRHLPSTRVASGNRLHTHRRGGSPLVLIVGWTKGRQLDDSSKRLPARSSCYMLTAVTVALPLNLLHTADLLIKLLRSPLSLQCPLLCCTHLLRALVQRLSELSRPLLGSMQRLCELPILLSEKGGAVVLSRTAPVGSHHTLSHKIGLG